MIMEPTRDNRLTRADVLTLSFMLMAETKQHTESGEPEEAARYERIRVKLLGLMREASPAIDLQGTDELPGPPS